MEFNPLFIAVSQASISAIRPGGNIITCALRHGPTTANAARVLFHSTWPGTTSMPSNYVTWHCREVTSSHGSRSMAWYTLPMPCAFGHKSMVNFFTHGFASHKGFPPPMILKDNKFLYNYGPSSRRPSVYLQWTAQCITLGVPSSCQFHLVNINRC